MKRHTISGAELTSYVPAHPERTAYRMHNGMNFDVTFQTWPSRAAMLKTIQMQGRRAGKATDWRDWSESRMAQRVQS